MPSRTQIVCLHEGLKGRSIDPVFYRTLVRGLNPAWLRPWPGSNAIRTVDCGGRKQLIERTPLELRACLETGSHTTLVVCADLDHDMPDGDTLRQEFWRACHDQAISQAEFESVVFVFAKDRLENWIEFLLTDSTDEGQEGPRVHDLDKVAGAARRLCQGCTGKRSLPPLPPSLEWSCRNWKVLVERMRG